MTNQRVIWDEGMMLAPQHFQQWERWLDAELGDRLQAAGSHGWGFTALEIDQTALAGGMLSLTHCAGILPDGTSFSCPTRDALPPAVQAADWIGDRTDGVTVHLAAPKHAQGATAYGDVGGPAPFVRGRTRVVDNARPETDREIATAAVNLALRPDSGDLAVHQAMPVARVVRGAGGGIAIAPDSCPPSLCVRAAPLAQSVLRATAGMLSQKWSDLSGKRRGGMADASGLMLLQTAGASLPVIRHCVEHGGVATEQAFLHLARLAAEMCTFHTTYTPDEVPAFDHGNPGPGLRRLGEMLQEMLGEAAPSLCDTLPLEREGESMFWARIPSPNMLTEGSLFLSVRADARDEDVQARLPTLTKISSKDRVQELLMRAIPGLPIKHVAQPPSAIPQQAGRQYFRLEPGGEHWEAIQGSLTVAIHVSPGLQQLQLDLLAVKQ